MAKVIPRRVIVSGSAGFIGSTLVPELRCAGYDVIGVDRRTGVDLFDPWSGPNSADVMIHLAAEASIPRVEAFPERAWRDNVDATARALQLGRDLGVETFVFTSSAAVYGPTRYGEQKRAAEHLVTSAHGFRRRIILRLFNVMGMDAPAGGVIHELVTATREHRAARIHGTGRQRRDFVPLPAVCRAITAAVEPSAPEGIHVMDVATGSAMSINELAERFGVATEHDAAREGDIPMSVGLTSAAAAVLGFTVTTSERDAMIAEILRIVSGPLGLI